MQLSSKLHRRCCEREVAGRELFQRVRQLSTTAAPAKPEKSDNAFVDNIGTIFLSSIALIIAWLVRSYYGTANKNAVRDCIEEMTSLDPCEIDELRRANSELKIDVFREIIQIVREEFPGGSCTYEEFILVVRKQMIQKKGEQFTIEFGHLIDRVALGALQRREKEGNDVMPISFWLTALTLALNSSVPERIQVLYEIMQLTNEKVTVDVVREHVGDLQDTCQLVPDSQVVETDRKYPFQQYKQGKGKDLVDWDGQSTDVLDVDAYAAILRTKSVCAWGECYHKKKIV